MEGYRSHKLHRYSAHGAARRAVLAKPPSPRRRVAKRNKGLSSSARKRRDVRALSPLAWGDEDGPFDLPFVGGTERVRVKRERSPPRDPSPDPDDDPAPANIRAALPIRPLARRERMNHDVEYTGSLSGGGAAWTVPIPSVVVVAQGAGYAQRATNFIRVSRLAFKITAVRSSSGSENTFTTPPFPDSFSRYNAMYFRFAVIYDKQCDTADPTVTYPDVFASGPALAINEFRLPATTQRFEVLHDCTYRWKNGELAIGSVEVAPPVQEPFWVQTGLVAKEEIFIDCEKIVRFFTSTGTVSDIVSGNIYYMVCSLGGDVSLTVTSRTSYSDNL